MVCIVGEQMHFNFHDKYPTAVVELKFEFDVRICSCLPLSLS